MCSRELLPPRARSWSPPESLAAPADEIAAEDAPVRCTGHWSPPESECDGNRSPPNSPAEKTACFPPTAAITPVTQSGAIALHKPRPTMVQPGSSNNSLVIVGSLRNVALRITDPADRQLLLDAANAHEETIRAMVPGDCREVWATRPNNEAVPTTVEPVHRHRVAKTLGVDANGLADWVDINEALRMTTMLSSLAPITAEPPRLTGPALRQQLTAAAAVPEEARVDPALDVPAVLAAIQAKYSAALGPAATMALTGSNPLPN